MPFKFVTNKIHTGKPGKTIDQMLKEAQAARQGEVKTASVAEAAPAPVAEVKAAAFPKGHEHKFKANSEKLKGGKGPADPTPADKNVEEKVGKKEASKETEIKLAGESEGEKGVEKYDAGKKEGTEFANDSEKKPEDPEKKATSGDGPVKPKKGKDGTETSGQPQWEGKKENNNDPWKDPKATDDKKAASGATVKLSVPSGSFVALANMKPELKKRTRDYFLTLYPPDYVDAMIADK